jgi:hypothetical protein
MGWHVLTVWECELKNPEKVLAKLQRLLTTKGTKENLKPPATYPVADDAELPVAAEEQAEYRTGKR